MHTNRLGRAETRSISVAASPATVLDLLSDPRRLPEWAPGFASTVEPDGQDWLIGSGGAQVRIRVEASRDHGTVDLLRPGSAGGGGAHMRVLNNENGSEFVFTLIFPTGIAEDLIAAQMQTVECELRAVRDLCEAGAAAKAGSG